MVPQPDNSPHGLFQRRMVRAVFVAFILYFCAGMIIRKRVGEPYPGFFMPSFPGVGLTRMTATEGETQVPRIEVAFSDGTTQDVSVALFCKGEIVPMLLMHQVVMEKGEADRRALSIRQRFKSAAKALLGAPPVEDKTLAPVPADIENYLNARAHELFPDKKVDTISFQVFSQTFPLLHPAQGTEGAKVYERTISLTHEGADRKN